MQKRKELQAELKRISASCIAIASLLDGVVDFADDFAGQDIVYNENAIMGNRLNIKIIEPTKQIKKESQCSQKIKEEFNLQKGSITKRKDGRYMGRYYDLKKQKSVYGKTKKECADKLKIAIKEVESRENNSRLDKSMLLNNWFNYYVEMYKKPTLKESTLKILQVNYNANIVDTIGLMPISKITPKVAKEFIESLYNNNRKRFCYNLLKDMFDKLQDYHLVKINVMNLFALALDKDEIKEKNEKEENTKFLSNEELNTLFDGMRNTKFGISKFYNITRFLVSTGLRAGEALALTWNDIDFENGAIRINKTFSSTIKKVQTTKTKAGNRIVPLFDNARLVLQEMMDERHKPNEKIFKKISLSSYSTTLSNMGKKYLDIAISPHSLRHTFISNCYEQGIDAKTVQTWVGHKSINITLDTYTHLSKEKEQEQTKLVNSLTLNLS